MMKNFLLAGDPEGGSVAQRFWLRAGGVLKDSEDSDPVKDSSALLGGAEAADDDLEPLEPLLPRDPLDEPPRLDEGPD